MRRDEQREGVGQVPRSREDVRGRLQQAALELYGDRGYDRTTAAEIAERAGVTERTFFRHFPDKREVLFEHVFSKFEAVGQRGEFVVVEGP